MIVLLQSNPGLQPIFSLPLADSGAGAVNTTPTVATGSPTATFTRATVAWTKLSTGLWAQVASGTARSCYLGADTTVGAYGGYFAEGAGTQLVTPTASIRDMTDASWVAVTMTAAKTATGIDGVVNSASTITATGATATILQTLVAAAFSRTYSAFVKRRTGTGTVLLKQGTATLDITALINSSTYTRVALNDNELNVAYGFQINTNGDAIDVDFNQFEAGAFATSPMASAGAARNMDVLSYATASNLLDATGSLYLETSQTFRAAAQGERFFSTFTGANGGAFNINSGKLSLYDGTAQRDGCAFSFSSSIQKAAWSWAASNCANFLAGTAVTGLTFDGSINSSANFSIGNDPSGSTLSMNGTFKNVRIYGTALTAAQLQAMTT